MDDQHIIITLPPYPVWAQFIDLVSWPLVAAGGYPKERVNETRPWNRKVLSAEQYLLLVPAIMATHPTDDVARVFTRLPWRAYVPKWGGWRRFAVLEPVEYRHRWYVGWHDSNVSVVSTKPVSRQVRVLLGPSMNCWFGLNAHGHQIPVQKIATGELGKNGRYRSVPLR